MDFDFKVGEVYTNTAGQAVRVINVTANGVMWSEVKGVGDYSYTTDFKGVWNDEPKNIWSIRDNQRVIPETLTGQERKSIVQRVVAELHLEKALNDTCEGDLEVLAGDTESCYRNVLDILADTTKLMDCLSPKDVKDALAFLNSKYN